MRDASGFRNATWDEALSFTAHTASRDCSSATDADAVAVYGGASMITEKAYLLGKFARVALGTRHIDYNGRLCMVSAGTAYKLVFGIDRVAKSLDRYSPGGRRPARRLQRRRVLPDHDGLHLAMPRPRRQADRRWIRA